MKSVDIKLFDQSAAFTLAIHRWGNRRRGNLDNVQTDAKKQRLHLTKQLIDAQELDSIVEFQNETKAWCLARCVPSYFKKGLYLAKLTTVEAIDARLREAAAELASIHIPNLVAVLPQRIAEARAELNGQFSEADYPAPDQLPAMFGFDWYWITFKTPANIPEELRKVEAEKLQKKMEQAGEEILLALRAGFLDLVNHAEERLRPGDDGRAKKFETTTITKIQDFIATFKDRDLMNDVDLARIISQAETIMTGVTPDALRGSADLRAATADKFKSVALALDPLVVERKARKFDFSED